MKKCSYCGKEYSDEITHCPIDGEPLSGGPAEVSLVSQVVALPVSSSDWELAANPTVNTWTERQLLLIEVTLVCVVAFGVSVLSSLYALTRNGSQGPSGTVYGSAMAWGYGLLREAGPLGLVWYLLLRRRKSFAGYGMVLTLRNIGESVLLWLSA